jgi:hypothetical protein
MLLGRCVIRYKLLAVKNLQPALFQPKFAERRRLSHIFLNLAKPIFIKIFVLTCNINATIKKDISQKNT